MLKNNKAVTLMILAITIIVLMILGGVTITTSNRLLKDTNRKTIMSNMYLIKGEVETIYDEYQFSEDESVLIGTLPTTDLSKYGVTVKEGDIWRVWGKEQLLELKLDFNMLKNNQKFIVNYSTSEIIYTEGFKNTDGNIEYTLTDMMENETK